VRCAAPSKFWRLFYLVCVVDVSHPVIRRYVGSIYANTSHLAGGPWVQPMGGLRLRSDGVALHSRTLQPWHPYANQVWRTPRKWTKTASDVMQQAEAWRLGARWGKGGVN
jgi:hypothetical protein